MLIYTTLYFYRIIFFDILKSQSYKILIIHFIIEYSLIICDLYTLQKIVYTFTFSFANK